MLRARARVELDKRRAEFDLRKFIEIYQPHYRDPTHMAEVCAELDRSMREPVYCALEAPPRHGKTSVLQAHCARLLKYRQKPRIAWCTYANDVAYRRSREVRELAARAGVWVGEEQKTAQQFDPSKSVAFWQTSSGGLFIAGGRHAQWVSEGFDLIVYDDALKDASEAESPTFQEEAWKTYRSTLMSRREPRCSVFVSHQRWNVEDVIGRLRDWLEKDPDAPPFVLITLRALENLRVETDSNGVERILGGDPLDPTRYDLPALIETASLLGDYFWPNFQQDVTPRGRKVFPELARYKVPQSVGAVLLVSCDPGIEGSETKEAKKTKPDPSGLVVAWAYLVDGFKVVHDRHGVARRVPCKRVQLDVIWAEQLWLEPLDLLQFLFDLQHVHYVGAPVLLEEASAFRILELVAARTHEQLAIVPVTPRGSKMLRSLPTAASAREQRVRVPEQGDWVPKFCKEVRTFTGKPGRKDNMVDALTQLHDYAEFALGIQEAGATSGGTSSMGRSGY